MAGAIDALTFYPAGKVMDLHGRRSVAVPCVIVLGVSFVLMPLTHGVLTLTLVAMLMGFGNGIGSGIVMTLGADTSPAIGRLTFLGIWREVSDVGTSVGPLVLSAITALAGLATASPPAAASALPPRWCSGSGSPATARRVIRRGQHIAGCDHLMVARHRHHERA